VSQGLSDAEQEFVGGRTAGAEARCSIASTGCTGSAHSDASSAAEACVIAGGFAC
jgi:hypothetical protein